MGPKIKFDYGVEKNNKDGKINYFTEKPNKKCLDKQFIRNTLGTSEEFITELQTKFFNDKNIENVNYLLKKEVFEKSQKKYVIADQNKKSLLIVMRWIWSMYSRNLDFDIQKQIDSLNKKVVKEIMPGVLSNAEQYFGYLKDVNTREQNNFQVNDLPVSTKMTAGTIEFPSLSETLQGEYKPPF